MINVFELVNISYSYPHAGTVLDNISLNITSGESIAILGVNGCGKSTLLKILSGLILADSGTLKFNSNLISAQQMAKQDFLSYFHQQIGFIFQDSDVQLFCNSVRDELAFGLLQQGIDRDIILNRVEEMSLLIGITHLLDKPPFKLSGGEKKKVALAAILLLNPQVIILDEPTNALDPKTQRWLVDMLRELQKIGKTIITTTHNLYLVNKFADRGILFNESHQIVVDLPIDELLQKEDLLREVNLIY